LEAKWRAEMTNLLLPSHSPWHVRRRPARTAAPKPYADPPRPGKTVIDCYILRFVSERSLPRRRVVAPTRLVTKRNPGIRGTGARLDDGENSAQPAPQSIIDRIRITFSASR